MGPRKVFNVHFIFSDTLRLPVIIYNYIFHSNRLKNNGQHQNIFLVTNIRQLCRLSRKLKVRASIIFLYMSLWDNQTPWKFHILHNITSSRTPPPPLTSSIWIFHQLNCLRKVLSSLANAKNNNNNNNTWFFLSVLHLVSYQRGQDTFS